MKRISIFFILLWATAVFLAACGSSPGVEEAASAGDLDKAVTSVPTATIENLDQPDADKLASIGETGRPQFLNAYASW